MSGTNAEGRNVGLSAGLEAAMQNLAVACIEYAGPLDDPRVGWTGGGAAHKDLFRCERCGAEHLDCFAIQHADGCSAKRLLDALAAVASNAKVKPRTGRRPGRRLEPLVGQRDSPMPRRDAANRAEEK